MTGTAAASDAELAQLFAHLPVERDTAEHYRGYLRRELVMNRCADCGRWHHPMRPMCPACWSWKVVPTAVSGRGTVHLFITLHQGPSAEGIEHGATREVWGRIAVNGRTNALRNPLAAMRAPITLDDYYAARMIREPLCMLDMDLPVDGADAFVLTSAERAKEMPHPAVLVHATATGMIGENTEDQLPSLERHGQHVVVEELKAKSDFWIDDVDLYYPDDGFTIITAAWIENTGWGAAPSRLSFGVASAA